MLRIQSDMAGRAPCRAPGWRGIPWPAAPLRAAAVNVGGRINGTVCMPAPRGHPRQAR
jgi:hypothetical protein